MEDLIEGVRLEPCLWNPLHPDYRETSVKEEAWHRVVRKYNNISIPTIQVAKLEWKRLRDNHRDALKRAKLGKNKLLPAHITTWKYAKAMQFLEPHMKYRITENIEMEPPGGNVEFNLKNSEQDVSTTEANDYTASNLNSPSNKRRRFDHHSDNTTIVRHNTDALESFFNCILESTREMPPWMQTQVKKKIFAVIIEAEEQLSCQEQNSYRDNNYYQNDLPIETNIKTEIVTEDSCDNGF